MLSRIMVKQVSVRAYFTQNETSDYVQTFQIVFCSNNMHENHLSDASLTLGEILTSFGAENVDLVHFFDLPAPPPPLA
jgi:hypothetical protein